MVKVGDVVPFLLDLPSIKALVIGVTGGQCILFQEYDTIDVRTGEPVHVENTYYRSLDFINSYVATEERYERQTSQEA